MNSAHKIMTDAEIKALVSLLDDNDPAILEMVESKVLSIGSSVIPFLEQEWNNRFEPYVQERLENLIHIVQFNLLKERLVDWAEHRSDDLLEGMWLISTFQYPDLQLEDVKAKLERLYYEAWLEFKDNIHPFDQIKLLNYAIFGKLKFRANNANFHAVNNSMINSVLETKKGNPISLCVIYMLIAQRLKLPVYGVNLPNLFILSYRHEGFQFYINAYNRGLIFSRSDIDNYITQLNLQSDSSFYDPCSHEDIIRRTLRNLIVAFDKLGETEKVEEVKELLILLSDGEIEDFGSSYDEDEDDDEDD